MKGRGILIEVFAQVGGTGSPVIFLPGMGWTAESVWPLLTLQERYAVHSLDLPGLGRSAPLPREADWDQIARWVKGYCDGQGFSTVRVIGHSAGGLTALAFADRFPERVHQLVLLDAGYQKIARFPSVISKPLRYLTPLLSLVAHRGGVEWVTRMAERSEPRDVSPEGMERQFQAFVHDENLVVSCLLREAFYAAMREVMVTPAGVSYLMALYRANPGQAFSRLKPPTLLVVPEAMTNRPPLTAIDELGLPVLLYEVPGGHFVHFSHPEIAGVIQDFFDHWS